MGDRVEELNDRIVSRSFPSCMIEPNLKTITSVSTRCTLFPISPHQSPNADVVTTTTYSPERCFAPNVQQPPDFATKIDIEMELRNQYFALQRGAEQRYYVPTSGSEMFFGGVGSHSLSEEWRRLGKAPGGSTTAAAPSPAPASFSVHAHTRTELRNY